MAGRFDPVRPFLWVPAVAIVFEHPALTVRIGLTGLRPWERVTASQTNEIPGLNSVLAKRAATRHNHDVPQEMHHGARFKWLRVMVV